jgi:uncharacterized protein (DUF2062 family)
MIKKFFLKFFAINDSPQKIALGAGLGVFLGIVPGTGLIAALFAASLLRANRAAALMGCLATNTWLSVVTFLLSIQVGSAILKLEGQAVLKSLTVKLQSFQFLDLFQASFLQVVLPLVIGYAIISFVLGAAVYAVTLIALIIARRYR